MGITTACTIMPHIPTVKHREGFTLIELMVAIAVFGVISTAIYATYHNQQRIYLAQEKVVEMQQNLRAAMFFIERDLRMIGYDPTERSGAVSAPGMIANIAELRFAYDENGDGLIQNNEYVRYALKRMTGSGIEEDGIAGTTRCCLARETGMGSQASGLQPVAENIDALEFVYHFADGSTATQCATISDFENVRSIDVSILARTGSFISGYRDAKKYYPASNPEKSETGTVWGPFNDGYQRRLLIANIKCRNMGL
ncbi:MAG: prepilin-type N-terminal cleavage/methylation domain-containing protein [Desulfobacterota bacterium]|nr:prepilin-type N-terminal cleavage/methylation domain-containing protein [Thermodesulfobacteriota bacterium]